MGRAYAAEFRDSAQPEWPPQPARLFSALVAAHHDTEGTVEEREALLWLEKQPPPHVAAKRAGQTEQVVVFVPTNYPTKSGNTHPEHRAKQPRFFPAQSPESPVVHFLWPDAEPSLEHTKALRRLASRAASLGRACSLVRIRLIDPTPFDDAQPKFVPDDNGTTVLAVAGAGRLEDLEANFLLGRRPQQASPERYRYLDPTQKTENPTQGHFGEMIVLRRVSGIGFPIESTHLLTQHLRKAFLSQAGKGSNLSPALSGHEGDNPGLVPHVAFVALPNVGGNFGDGRLMGLGVVLPASLNKADRRIALRACASIDSLNLGELGEWVVEIANFDVPPRTLKPETWMRPAQRWNTVTPILLDRYPKKNLPAAELLVTACLRAGLPAPTRCTLGTYPNPDEDLKGVPPVFAFSTPRWAVHASLEFEMPIKGPVLVGAGRFFGMGLMRPASRREKAAPE